MAISDVIRGAVATAFGVLDESLPDITLERYVGDDPEGLGNRRYGDPETHKAVIKHEHRWVRAADMTDRLSRTNLSVKTTVNERDRITLPDGSAPQILSVSGLLDEAGSPYLTRVFF